MLLAAPKVAVAPIATVALPAIAQLTYVRLSSLIRFQAILLSNIIHRVPLSFLLPCSVLSKNFLENKLVVSRCRKSWDEASTRRRRRRCRPMLEAAERCDREREE